jgi:hypothetical protein
MKRTILFVVLAVVLVLAFYGYREYVRKNKNLTEVAAEETVTAPELIRAFETDSAGANKKYLGKIVAVQGTVKSVETEPTAATIILGEAGSMSSVRCSMDTLQVKQATTVKAGQPLTVKGALSGFNKDELLGSDVILNRCVIQSDKSTHQP